MKLRHLYIFLIVICIMSGAFFNSGISFADGGNSTPEETEDNINNPRVRSPSSSANEDREPNNNFNLASLLYHQPSNPPILFFGSFNYSTDVDYYKLYLGNGHPTGSPASNFYIALDGSSLSSSAYFEVYDPDRHFIGRSANTIPMVIPVPSMSFLAPASGYYYIVIRQIAPGTTGDYSINFFNNTLTNDMYDGDNSISRARYIKNIFKPGGSYNQSFLEEYKDIYDFWKFDGFAGMNITVNLTTAATCDFDIYMYEGATKTLLDQSAHTGTGWGEELQENLTNDGFHYVIVQVRIWPGAKLDSGNYDLRISASVGPVWNNSLSDNISLEEDSDTVYVSLNQRFIELNEQEMTFKIWNRTTSDWDDKFQTDNISVFIKQNSSVETVLEIKLKPNKFGSDVVKFKVSDEDSLTTYKTNNITIREVNDKPVMNATSTWPVTGGTASSNPDKISGTQDTQLYFQVIATDVDLVNPAPYQDELTYNVTFYDKGTTDLTQVPFTINELTGEVTYTPTNDHVGTFTVNISVTDHPFGQQNVTISRMVDFVIENVNDAPVLDPADNFFVDEDHWLNYTFTGIDYDQGDDLTFKGNFTSHIVSGKFNFYPNGTMTFLPDNDDVGILNLNVTVYDNDNSNHSRKFIIKVNNTNDPPVAVIASPTDGQVVEAQTESVSLDATGSYDDDVKHGDSIKYAWQSSLDGDLGSAKSFQTKFSTEGSHTITLTVTDNKNVVATASVNIMVVPYKIPVDGDAAKPTLNLTQPLNGSMITTKEILLVWEPSYFLTDYLTYNVYLYEEGKEPEIVAENITETTYLALDLKDKTKYYWMVIPWYSILKGKCWNGPFSFSVDTAFVATYAVELGFTGSTLMKPGETKNIEFTITNIGNVVDNVEITIESETDKLTATFQDGTVKTYIYLFKEESKSITLVLTASSDIPFSTYDITITALSINDITAKGEIKIPVEITSGDGQDGTDDSKKGKGEEGNMLLIAIVLIIIIFLILAFFILYRKRKAEEKAVEGQKPEAVVDVTIPLPHPYEGPTPLEPKAEGEAEIAPAAAAPSPEIEEAKPPAEGLPEGVQAEPAAIEGEPTPAELPSTTEAAEAKPSPEAAEAAAPEKPIEGAEPAALPAAAAPAEPAEPAAPTAPATPTPIPTPAPTPSPSVPVEPAVPTPAAAPAAAVEAKPPEQAQDAPQVKCPECDYSLESPSPTCPRCGANIN
ncbi:MAG: hypothetical protein JSV49_08010 [Thermoplasmata archaeon]|nr:MAG: hypothetical protein JSV49_08010 [Thermoplasmata archaeon]